MVTCTVYELYLNNAVSNKINKEWYIYKKYPQSPIKWNCLKKGWSFSKSSSMGTLHKNVAAIMTFFSL